MLGGGSRRRAVPCRLPLSCPPQATLLAHSPAPRLPACRWTRQRSSSRHWRQRAAHQARPLPCPALPAALPRLPRCHCCCCARVMLAARLLSQMLGSRLSTTREKMAWIWSQWAPAAWAASSGEAASRLAAAGGRPALQTRTSVSCALLAQGTPPPARSAIMSFVGLGSVSDYCVGRLECPVIVVKS